MVRDHLGGPRTFWISKKFTLVDDFALVFCHSRFVSNIEPFTLYYNSLFNF